MHQLAYMASRIDLFRIQFWMLMLISTVVPAQVVVAQQPAVPDFAEKIRPLLSDRCYACHGPDQEHREGDLRLDELAGIEKPRDSGRIIVPGDADASLLVQRIFSEDVDKVMPPPDSRKSLTANEKELIKAWIAGGAKWRQHWAYELPVPVVTPTLGQANGDSGGYNWIDNFIFQKFRAAGAAWSPDADAITLQRRVAFDLTGLPPARDEANQIGGQTDEEYSRYVERLLASPAFGERLAVYWLDLVRYADSVGYHGDQEHHSTPYRDYVINALNDGLPFDQFTREQLAGDLLDHPSEEQVAATCYNRLLQTSHEGGVQPKEYLAIYAADRVRNVSAVWMGATVGCAQCHDHKFDPYSSKNFYELAAFFADVDEATHLTKGADSSPTQRFPEKEFLDRVQRQELTHIQAELSRLEAERARSPGPATDDAQRQAVEASELAELDKLIASLKEQAKRIGTEKRRAMITVSTDPRIMRVLPRGNWLDETGETVAPALPSFLGSVAKRSARATRLDLANWFVDAQQGAGLLTARVFANRFWYLMFGEGLSTSLEDFGGQGDAPSHPELLDQLAFEFVRSGWDIKHMFRLIANSRTYRQSSLESNWHRQFDPENRLFSRQSRFRLPAEFVRDVALASGNLLVRQVGGDSARPYQPAGYYKHLNFPTRDYKPDQSIQQWRRGVYTHWQRMYLHPMLRAFDAPSREECTSKRGRSNTPLSALVLMNDPTFVEAARGLAMQVLNSTDGDDHHKLKIVFQTVNTRDPDKFERETLWQLLEQARQAYCVDAESAKKLLAVGMLPSTLVGIDTSELAAWTTVARSVLNLGEAYTRN